MTIIREVTKKCPLCKNIFTGYSCVSVHYFRPFLLDGCSLEGGSPDMCPNCGYVSYDFKKRPKLKLIDICGDDYQTCDGLAKKLHFDEFYLAEYRMYLLHKWAKDYEGMYYALRKCMHVYGKKIHRCLLPEVYELFCKVNEEKLKLLDKKAVSIQCFYLRMLRKFKDARAVLKQLDFQDPHVYENRRLQFEAELVQARNSQVLDLGDYEKWEHKLMEKLYGDVEE